MIKENTRPFALHDSAQAQWGERLFLVCQVFSCFEGGLVSVLDQKKMRPSMVICIKTFFLLPACLVMMKPDAIPHAFYICLFCAAWASGGILQGLCVFVHEEYGLEAFGPIYGMLLTAGAFGFYGFNEVLYAGIFEDYAVADTLGGEKELKEYGEWNQTLFGLTAGAAFIAFILTVVSHISLKTAENKIDNVVF